MGIISAPPKLESFPPRACSVHRKWQCFETGFSYGRNAFPVLKVTHLPPRIFVAVLARFFMPKMAIIHPVNRFSGYCANQIIPVLKQNIVSCIFIPPFQSGRTGYHRSLLPSAKLPLPSAKASAFHQRSPGKARYVVLPRNKTLSQLPSRCKPSVRKFYISRKIAVGFGSA